MNKSGRLELIKSTLTAIPKSTLTAIPIHVAICIRLLGWVFKALEKIMKAFMWTETEVVNAGKCLAAWSKVQTPKEMEGLGVLDIQQASKALRLRWLWERRNNSANIGV